MDEEDWSSDMRDSIEEPRSLSLVRGTGMAALSPQQREVALLIVAGKSNREIAEKLFISTHTVRSHIYNIYEKLHVQSRVEAINKISSAKN